MLAAPGQHAPRGDGTPARFRRYRDTENVVHPAPATLPLSTVSFLLGGPALRPTMEYPAGMVIQ